jgi:hypothetical protein
MAELSRAYRKLRKAAPKKAAKKVRKEGGTSEGLILVCAERLHRGATLREYGNLVIRIEKAAKGVRPWFDRILTRKGVKHIAVVFKARSLKDARLAARRIRALGIGGLKVAIETH